jgi:hypothetical protein
MPRRFDHKPRVSFFLLRGYLSRARRFVEGGERFGDAENERAQLELFESTVQHAISRVLSQTVFLVTEAQIETLRRAMIWNETRTADVPERSA